MRACRFCYLQNTYICDLSDCIECGYCEDLARQARQDPMRNGKLDAVMDERREMEALT